MRQLFAPGGAKPYPCGTCLRNVVLDESWKWGSWQFRECPASQSHIAGSTSNPQGACRPNLREDLVHRTRDGGKYSLEKFEEYQSTKTAFGGWDDELEAAIAYARVIW